MRAFAAMLAITLTLALASTSALIPKAASAQPYRRVENAEKRIALTFDDGPHPRYTAEILDILKEYGVRATFFVIGENIEYYGNDIIPRILSEGHEIGNHTFSHAHTRKMDRKALLEDVDRCHSIMKERYGYEMRLFRPPEGYVDKKITEAARAHGYSTVLWSIDTRDWEHTAATLIVSNVEHSVSGGDIILMHDYVSKPSTTAVALRELIPRLLGEGYQFVTVSELISQA